RSSSLTLDEGIGRQGRRHAGETDRSGIDARLPDDAACRARDTDREIVPCRQRLCLGDDAGGFAVQHGIGIGPASVYAEEKGFAVIHQIRSYHEWTPSHWRTNRCGL